MTRPLLVAALLAWLAPAPATDTLTRAIEVTDAGEVAVTIAAGCAGCDWGASGREGVALRLTLDGRYSQHLMLTRGESPADYVVSLGALTKGRHQLAIERDATLSAKGAGAATIEVTQVETLVKGASDDYTGRSMSPILYARPNTVGRFTDLPLLMWYEVVPTPRGRQYRYSVIFSNEDGGTPTDRLMATWGRTTDIEFVYGVEIDADGRVLAEEFQGPGHEVPPFKGRREAGHPLLWVSTDNNMVSESGPTAIRYALPPARVDLTDKTREIVMDDNPWLYGVMAAELAREGKIVDAAPPGGGTIPDPRRFVYVDACGEVGHAALALALGVGRAGTDPPAIEWIPSDRGMRPYRIVRDGCFRIATPLPAGLSARDIRAVRFMAYERPPAANAPAAPANPVTLTRVNALFMLDDAFRPQSSRLQWLGAATIAPGGAAFELPIP